MPADISAAEPPALHRDPVAWGALLAVGVAWGCTQLFSKLVVTEGHHPIGITLAGTVLGAVLLLAYLGLAGRPLPLARRHLIFYGICGLTGTALPHVLSFTAMQELPVGVMSIVVAVVPITTFLGALVLRMERAEPLRLLGLVCGMGAVLLLVVPEASLPSPDQAAWIALPVIMSLSYTVENIYIARAQPRDCDPMQTMCGLFCAATIMLVPVTAASGTWMEVGRLTAGELWLTLMTVLHIGAYAGFVWLIARAGPVFSAQVAYIVTLVGVVLGIAVLGEQNSAWVWASLVLMMTGLALVRPRRT